MHLKTSHCKGQFHGAIREDLSKKWNLEQKIIIVFIYWSLGVFSNSHQALEKK